MKWLPLAALTLLSGSATVKLPSVPATISVSETFVFTAVLLYGPAAGAVIDAIDGLIISLWLGEDRKKWYQVAFNVTAPALSIWCASQVYFAFGVHPLLTHPAPIEALILPLAAFATVHFVLNTWLVAVAVSFQMKQAPFSVWRRDFLWLSLNYYGGASVAALVAVYSRDVNPVFLGVIVPLLLVLYYSFKIPMARVEDSHRHVAKVNSLYMSTIETLALAIDAKDQVTHGHIRRVQFYAMSLARALGIKDDGLLKAIETSALLHDMGKLAVAEHILNKPGRLTAAEFEKMKVHASIGAQILSLIDFPFPVVPIVRHHHESWDGSGYPDGLKGPTIPIGARILAVVDCYDALTSDRPYRPQLPHESAIAILNERRGRMYDPLVVDTFVRLYGRPTDVQELRQAQAVDAPIEPRLLRSEQSAISTSVPTTLLHRTHALFGHPTWTDLCRSTAASALIVAAYDNTRDDLLVRIIFGRDHWALKRGRVAMGHGVIGWVAANRQAIVNSDPALDLGPLGLSFDGLTSGLVLPVCSSDDLIGVVALYRTEDFNHEHKAKAQASAMTVAAAVEEQQSLDKIA